MDEVENNLAEVGIQNKETTAQDRYNFILQQKLENH